MNPVGLLLVVLLASGCQTADARIAKENADLKAQRDSLVLYIQSLQRERAYMQGQIEDMHRELDKANGRKTF